MTDRLKIDTQAWKRIDPSRKTLPRYNQAASLYWAERAMNPIRGYSPMEVRDGLGYHHGFVVAISNFPQVEEKLLADYQARSMDRRRPLPIWC